MTKIMLVTASFGDGHKQVAAALEEQFRKRGVETFTVDCFRESNHFLARVNEWIYDTLTRYIPWLYGASYRLTQGFGPRNWLWRALALMSSRSAVLAVEEHQPDAVLQLFPDHALERLDKSASRPLIGVVVTDYSIHGRWFHPNVDVYFLPHQGLDEPARPFAALARRVHAGIPVRESLHWDRPDFAPKYPYILLATGGRGVFSDLSTAIRLIRNAFQAHHIYVMCGRNEQMRNMVRELGTSVDKLYPLPFVDNVGQWMRHAEFAVIKSGGITVTECLVCSCPIVAYRPQPGQEEDNARFLEQLGAGVTASNEKSLQLVLQQLQRRSVLEQMRRGCRQAAIPDAASRVADDVLNRLRRDI